MICSFRENNKPAMLLSRPTNLSKLKVTFPTIHACLIWRARMIATRGSASMSILHARRATSAGRAAHSLPLEGHVVRYDDVSRSSHL